MKRLVRLFAPLSLPLVAGLVTASCSSTSDEPTKLTEEQLMDPEACKTCHPDQFREWSGSMHAYASDDPLFRAMNRRMQRVTDGKLGTFCAQCHMPLAVKLGLTKDGLDIDTLPAKMRGVSCFFCHEATPGPGQNNNPLVLAHDGVMRGGIPNPVPNTAHVGAYSAAHDRESPEGVGSVVCGPCHDIQTPQGAPIERTFKEWTQSVYARGADGITLACGQCHMPSRIGVAAQAPSVFERRVHDHSMPGVDLALQPFPEMPAQHTGVQASLDGALGAMLCVRPGKTGAGSIEAEVSLRNLLVGHGWPSGSAQDRRAWLEIEAYRGQDVVYASGRFADDEAVDTAKDPDLLLLRDRIYGADGQETHNFWEAVRFDGVQLLPPPSSDTTDPNFDRTMRKVYAVDGGAAGPPDRVTIAVHMRPFDLDLIEDLLASGDLTDPTFRSKITTFTLASTKLEWSTGLGRTCVP